MNTKLLAVCVAALAMPSGAVGAAVGAAVVGSAVGPAVVGAAVVGAAVGAAVGNPGHNPMKSLQVTWQIAAALPDGKPQKLVMSAQPVTVSPLTAAFATASASLS